MAHKPTLSTMNNRVSQFWFKGNKRNKQKYTCTYGSINVCIYTIIYQNFNWCMYIWHIDIQLYPVQTAERIKWCSNLPHFINDNRASSSMLQWMCNSQYIKNKQ